MRKIKYWKKHVLYQLSYAAIYAVCFTLKTYLL